MDVELAICAESAVLDQTTNKLSLFGIVEELSGAGFPGFIPNVFFVLFLKRKKSEPEKLDFKISVELNGTSFFSAPFSMSFQGKLRARAIANLQGVPIAGPGHATG